MKKPLATLIVGIILLLNPVVNAQFVSGRFIFYFNYPPDSLVVNNKLIHLEGANSLPIDSVGEYRIRAVLVGWQEVVKIVNVVKINKIYQVRIRFDAKENLSESQLDSLEKILPLKTIFVKSTLTTNKNISTLLPLSAGFMIDSPITSHVSFDFRFRISYPITTYLYEDKKVQFLQSWHAGFAYKF